MNKETMIFTGLAVGAFVSSLICYQYNNVKARKLEEKKVENERLYFSKLTPEQVERLEKDKIDLKKAEIELKNTETELKKTVADFKAQVQSEIETKVMTNIHDNMRSTFDEWSAKYENRLDAKVDRVVERIDNLSDKYGGVKSTGQSAPSISVVNAPNN